MNRFLLSVALTVGAVALAACSSPSSGSGPGSAFVLVGALNASSPAASANFLIDGNSCNYYVYRGDGSSPAQATKSCTVMQDQANAMGQPHGSVKIGFSGGEAQQVLTLTQGANNTLSAKTVPDIGMFVPKSWSIAKPEADMILNSTAAGSVYSGIAIRLGGVSCSMTVTPVAKATAPASKTAAPASASESATPLSNGNPVSMPCGLVFWDSESATIAIPGSLISSTTATQTWKLQFYKNGATWNLSQPPFGFPATYAEAAPATK